MSTNQLMKRVDIKEIRLPNQDISNMLSEKANHFVDVFTNLGEKLAQKINPSIGNKKKKTRPKFYILRGIYRSRDTSSPGLDSISPNCVRAMGESISAPICQLSNVVLKKGIFPCALKK